MAWEQRDRYLCSASDDRTLKLWNAVNGECLRTLEGHTNYVVCCNFNPQGNRLVSIFNHSYAYAYSKIDV